jgi:hypothetical protein
VIATLSPKLQAAVLSSVRQVIIDTTSNVLGAIDGRVGRATKGICLLDAEGKTMSGDLQDQFLAFFEK